MKGSPCETKGANEAILCKLNDAKEIFRQVSNHHP